jgi:CBS domain-containing protein
MIGHRFIAYGGGAMFRPLKPSSKALAAGRRGLQLTLGELIQRPPVTVTTLDSIARGMQAMADARVGSVVVVAPDSGRPVGIVTLQDVLCRVALPRADIGQAITVVMTPDPVTLKRDATARQASLLMAERHLRHLLITDDLGRLSGIISKNDIFDLLCATCSAVRRK